MYVGMVKGPGCPSGEGSVHKLEIIPEPEAAALYCIEMLKKQRPTTTINMLRPYKTSFTHLS
jgi:hypothetical protein